MVFASLLMPSRISFSSSVEIESLKYWSDAFVFGEGSIESG
jgi:hypothetical protein